MQLLYDTSLWSLSMLPLVIYLYVLPLRIYQFVLNLIIYPFVLPLIIYLFYLVLSRSCIIDPWTINA